MAQGEKRAGVQVWHWTVLATGLVAACGGAEDGEPPQLLAPDEAVQVTSAALVAPESLTACVDSEVVAPFRPLTSGPNVSASGILSAITEQHDSTGMGTNVLSARHALTSRGQSKLVVMADAFLLSGFLDVRALYGDVGASLHLRVRNNSTTLCESEILIDSLRGFGDQHRSFDRGLRTVSCTVPSWQPGVDAALFSDVTVKVWASGVIGTSVASANTTLERVRLKRCVEPDVLTDGLGRCAGPAFEGSTVVRAQECTGSPQQRWELVGDTSARQLRHRASGLCLNPAFDWVGAGTLFLLQPCDPAKAAQQFLWFGNSATLSPDRFCKLSAGQVLCLAQPPGAALLQLEPVTTFVGGPPEQFWAAHPPAAP